MHERLAVPLLLWIGIELDGGHLWLRWNDLPNPRHLVAVGEADFAIPADFGVLRFRAEASGRYDRLVWDFGGDDPPTYTRAP